MSLPPSLPPFLPPRGWHADPTDPLIARWWDGAAWTTFTHRAARSMPFGPAYTHSYWVGPNRDAGRSRLAALIATFLILACIIFSITTSLDPMAGSALILLIGFAVSGAFCVANIVFASRALLRSAQLGARGRAISDLVIGSLEALICLGAFAVLAVTLAF